MTRQGRSPRECSGTDARPYPWSWDDTAGRHAAGSRNAVNGTCGLVDIGTLNLTHPRLRYVPARGNNHAANNKSVFNCEFIGCDAA